MSPFSIVTFCLACVQAFGGELSDEEVEGLFQRAGEARNGTVGVNDLANLLQQHQLEGNLFKIIKRYGSLFLIHKP